MLYFIIVIAVKKDRSMFDSENSYNYCFNEMILFVFLYLKKKKVIFLTSK